MYYTNIVIIHLFQNYFSGGYPRQVYPGHPGPAFRSPHFGKGAVEIPVHHESSSSSGRQEQYSHQHPQEQQQQKMPDPPVPSPQHAAPPFHLHSQKEAFLPEQAGEQGHPWPMHHNHPAQAQQQPQPQQQPQQQQQQQQKVMEPGRSRFSTFPPTTSLPVPGSSVHPRTSQQFTIPQQRPCTLAGKGGQRSTLYPSGTRKGALRRSLALLETPRPRSSTPPLLNLQPAHSRGALHARPHLRSKKPTVSRPNRRRRRSERLKLLMGWWTKWRPWRSPSTTSRA